jgi:hypothetical protein
MCDGTEGRVTMSEKRIAYFVSKWYLHQQVLDGALMFAENDYKVDLFLYQASSAYHNLKQHHNISIYDLTYLQEEKLLFPRDNGLLFSNQYEDLINGKKKTVVFGTGQRALELMSVFPVNVSYYLDNNSEKWSSLFMGKEICSPSRLLTEDLSNITILIASMYQTQIKDQLKNMGIVSEIYDGTQIVEQYIFNKYALEKSKQMIEAKRYTAFIGMEKVGLIWAGMLADIFNVPYLYHSLELYNSDHPLWGQERFNPLLQQESYYHQRASATIIQDESRKNIIFSDHQITNGNPLYVTISILDDAKTQTNIHFWHNTFNIPLHKKIVLMFSLIGPNRYCKELVEASQTLDDGYQVIIHGPLLEDSYYDELQQANIDKKVIISTEIYKDDLLPEIMASANIGLVCYKYYPINDRLTVYSSEKIARYLQAGLPIITFDYDEYINMLNSFHCGQYISPSFENLSTALNEINSHYSQYKRNARYAYEQSYEFRKQYAKVIQFVEGV